MLLPQDFKQECELIDTDGSLGSAWNQCENEIIQLKFKFLSESFWQQNDIYFTLLRLFEKLGIESNKNYYIHLCIIDVTRAM